MWDLTIPGNNDHDFYILPAQTGEASHLSAGVAPVLVHNANGCEGFDPGRYGNRLSNGDFTNLKPADLPGPFKALNNNSLYRQSGTYNYVVRSDGSLVVASRAYGHIDLAQGGAVRAAGEVTIKDGQITRINNNPGHYRPYGNAPASAAIDAFETQGGFAVDPSVYVEVPVP